ncbi:uncharacterized protein LOC131161796 [Malania oleifera]|uniref:uncharacterized protein LOC131161796 n=1 Tax=Malania oleifera TaxID=397392 RepID=UPI0025AE239F|nr:uncharacterized protein LOC131161796 [Malania oleifera]XP_057973751.1 uncharacterized protein LOC131161796 [Malania oleifera]
MAKVSKVRRKSCSRHLKPAPYPLQSCTQKVLKDVCWKNKCSEALEKKEWDNAVCSVCLEFPHSAVLLLCSSYNKGCRPYMCATSYRYSNCLDQYKKAYTKVTSTESTQPWHMVTDNLTDRPDSGGPDKKMEVLELPCPLCRGQVKGWTVVEPARKYLNSKKRTCMQDGCSFVGTYKELRKHVKVEHPFARPREVDPVLEEKWKRLEHEREWEDVMSTISSSMPGAVVMGDYVIEGNFHGFFRDIGLDTYLGEVPIHLESSGSRRNGGIRLHRSGHRGHHSVGEEEVVHRGVAAGARSGRLLAPGRPRRRRRHREADERSIITID